MSIYKTAVNRPISTIMFFIGVIVVGLYSLTRIPIDLYPEINFPAITVLTSYPGANSAEIEQNITKRLENQLSTIENLKNIRSVSSDNLSVITLEFEWEANLDEATNKIRDLIDRVTLPEGSTKPIIFKFSSSDMPILFYAVTASQSYSGLDKILEEIIINPLNRIPGVGAVNMIGRPKRTVYVEIDPLKLNAYNITLEQIANVINGENLNMPIGNLKTGLMDFSLRLEGEFETSMDLENLVIGSFQGKTVYLKDVARIEDRLRDRTNIERILGERGLRMFVQKQSGANTVQINEAVKKQLTELIKLLPSDIKITEIFDPSTFIKNSLSNLASTLMYAFIFVSIIIFIFLGRTRAAIIVILTIPISLLTSFLYLFISGNTINIISLSSLALAIGMVVDDAIVVLENIVRHVERGSNPREASIYATNEIWLAVIVTTLVIVAVFFPLTLVGGMTGVMFKQLGWIVTITVSSSTIAAITLTPVLTSKFIKAKELRSESRLFRLWKETFEKFFNSVELLYEKSLRYVLKHKRLTITIAAAVFVLTMMLFRFIGTDFMPQSDQSMISGTIELPVGTRVEETVKTAIKLEEIIQTEIPEHTIYFTSCGTFEEEQAYFATFLQSASHTINFGIRLKNPEERERSSFEIAEMLRKRLRDFPEIVKFTVNTSMGGMSMGGNNVQVEIYGHNFDQTTQLAYKIKERIERIEGAREVTISRQSEKPVISIKLKKDKLAQHGLNTAYVSMYLRNRITGRKASIFREEGREYDIIVRYDEQHRQNFADIENMLVITPTGRKIYLKEIATITEQWIPPAIERKRKERVVTVSATPYKISLGQLANAIKKELASLDIPPGIMINIAGAYEDQQKSFRDLGLLLLLSIILVYLVMAAQFESFRSPFIIMFSVPFSFSGVALALFLTGTTLSVIAGLGAVLLIGIVVKNGIVLIDYINLMRDRGNELTQAIALSGRNRLRPILMTALTTIFSMVPLAIFGGEGSELWQPLGITVIGGLTFSTFVSLYIIPVLYAVFARRSERDKIQRIRKSYKFLIENEQ